MITNANSPKILKFTQYNIKGKSKQNAIGNIIFSICGLFCKYSTNLCINEFLYLSAKFINIFGNSNLYII